MVKLKLGCPNMVKLKFPSKNRPNMVKLSSISILFSASPFFLHGDPVEIALLLQPLAEVQEQPLPVIDPLLFLQMEPPAEHEQRAAVLVPSVDEHRATLLHFRVEVAVAQV